MGASAALGRQASQQADLSSSGSGLAARSGPSVNPPHHHPLCEQVPGDPAADYGGSLGEEPSRSHSPDPAGPTPGQAMGFDGSLFFAPGDGFGASDFE